MAVPENAAESGNATKKEIFIVQIKENSEGHFVKKAEVRLLAFCRVLVRFTCCRFS